MQPENAIEVRNLTKKFKVYMDKGSQLKERVLFRKRNRYEERWVLNGISFNVRKGEAVGLIGHNGCGKSTTLKLLTKIIYPDGGTVDMSGRVSSLIELGAGFHPDMSGRENIYTNASIFGLSKKEIDARVDEIIAFSELEDYIDNPVRTYSSGMYMRLAFSVAINVDADILLIDEILAVGDAHFQEKCFEKMQEIKKSGTTIVIVSHSLGQIEEICDRSIWIDAGRIRMDGQPKEVHEKYLEYMGVKTAEQKREKIREEQEKEREKQEKQEQQEQQLAASTFLLQDICYTDEKGESTHLYQPGKTGSLTLAYSVDQVCEHAELAFSIGADEWVAVKGTDLKAIPVGTFATEVKQSRLLTYLSDVARGDENLMKQMSGAQEIELLIKGDNAAVQETFAGIAEVEKCIPLEQKDEACAHLNLIAKPGMDIRERVFASCVNHGFVILQMNPVSKSLEDVFLELTEKEGTQKEVLPEKKLHFVKSHFGKESKEDGE